MHSSSMASNKLKDLSTEDEAQAGEGDIVLLWGVNKRRDGRYDISSEAHARVLKSAKPYFVASILAGYEGTDPWPESNQALMSKIIARVWLACARRLGDVAGRRSSDVDTVPTQAEARKVQSILLSPIGRATNIGRYSILWRLFAILSSQKYVIWSKLLTTFMALAFRAL